VLLIAVHELPMETSSMMGKTPKQNQNGENPDSLAALKVFLRMIHERMN
jgi:hypothetical protein